MKTSIFTKIVILLGWMLGANASEAGSIQRDKGFIKQMLGCHEVTFQYAETFSNIAGYKFPERSTSKALELVFLESESDDTLDIYHFLATPHGIIKHWRQKWVYENQDIYTFQPPMDFKYSELTPEQSQGKWTQKVYQVDDGPRYECVGSWAQQNGQTYFECEVDSPVPRRDLEHALKYNLLARRNRHIVEKDRHIHEQDNIKTMVESSGERKPLVMEKGLNTYAKLPMTSCSQALNWWQKSKHFWLDVDKVWKELYESRQDISFKLNTSDERRWMELFAMAKKYENVASYNSEEARAQIKNTLFKYLN